MKKIISSLLTAVLLAAMLTVCVPAKGDRTYTINSFEELEEAFDELDDNTVLRLNIKKDIVFEDEIEIDCSDVEIYLNGPATLLLPGVRGFYVDDKNVRMHFDGITIKGTESFHGDGQGIYVNSDGVGCLISGARFEGCGSIRKGESSYGLVDWSGGAIGVDGESCTIENCDFIECQTMHDGGGIYIDDEKCVVSNCYFEKCIAYRSGASIYVCHEQTDAKILNCKFVDCGWSNKIGTNVFAMGHASVENPHPYSKDDKLYHGCTPTYTGEAFRPVKVLDIPEGEYIIYSALSPDRCLDIAGGKDAISNGGNLHIWSISDASGNKFVVRKDKKTGAYSISPKHSGLELSVSNDTPNSGASIIQWEDYGNKGQRWIFEDAGDGYVHIRSLFGNYVDVYASGTAEGTDVISFRYLGSNGQKFRMEKIQTGLSIRWFAGSTLSQGSIWIVIGIAVVAIGTVAALVVVKKKKKPAKESEE